MPLARLENFLKNINGNTLYVDPNEIDSTDSIENRGNSRTRPFKTIQRALLEAARFSYVEGSNNDLFDQTTILISPGTHYIDNRPGYYWDGSNFKDVNNNSVSITELSVASNMDLESSTNVLYIYNSAEGGVILPKGVSIVASDLRKTKIRPKFVPDPVNDNIARSAIFRLTGGSYIFGFTIFDGNPVGSVYNTYTTTTVNPTYSHHKLTAFEYADGKNIFENSTLTDLDNYYLKVSYGYGNFSGRAIPDTLTDLQSNPEENKIVGDLGQGSVDILSVVSGDGTTASETITITTKTDHNLTPFTPIEVSGIGDNLSVNIQQQFNGSFVVAQVISPTEFTYLLDSPPGSASPSSSQAKVKVQSDTVSSSSPYVFNCSLKSVYGMNGLHADGSKATGFKSIVTAQFTGISLQRDDRAFVKYDETSGTYKTQNDLGTTTILHQDSESRYKPSWESFHIKASNDSFIQCVSIFAIGYAKQFVAESGGDQSITNSNSNFGAISLHSSGFKDYQLLKDNHAFITHIIPPKSIDDTESNISCYTINSSLTYSNRVSNNYTRIYLNGFTDKLTPPKQKVRGYTIGARNEDKVYFSPYVGFATITPNYEVSYNIESIGNSEITVEGTLTGITTNRAVRVISNNAVLPDGIENNKVYYVSPTSLTSNTLKLRESLSSISDVSIKNQKGLDIEDNLKLVFRVIDTTPDEPGNPFVYDSTLNNWYLNVTSSSESTAFINALQTQENPVFYIKRKIDSRTNDDKVYRARIVIPKESENASELTSGFIIQKSSSELNSLYSQSNFVSLSSNNSIPINTVRNPGIIIDAWYSGGTATIITKTPHKLNVGNKIKVYNLKSSNEPAPVGLGTGTGFNGSFVVSEVVDNLQFKFAIDRNPGGISTTSASSVPSWLDVRNCASTTYRIPPYTVDSSNRDDLPYFTCEEVNNDFQVYKIKTIQKYSQNDKDGIYHVYLNTFKNTPDSTVTPFNVKNYRLSQNLDNLYPEFDIDNVVSDVEATTSTASRKTIGKVEVNDPRYSTTKETAIQYLEDFGGGIGISSISAPVGGACTVTTALDHNVNGIRQLQIITPGSGFVNGVYYDIPLCGGSGRGATVNLTVIDNQVSQINLNISYPGCGYAANDVLTIKGIPGSTNTANVRVASLNTENLGYVQILGSIYPENNGLFKITSITPNTIKYSNPSGKLDTTGTGAVIPNISAYPISLIAYDPTSKTTTVITSKSNPFLVGNKVQFQDRLGTYSVISVNSTTSFKVSGQIFAPTPSTVCSVGLNAQSKDTNTSNENVGARHVPIFDGFKGRIQGNFYKGDTEFSALLANNDISSTTGLNKGDFLLVDDEIILITSLSGVSINCTRGVLGTKESDHPSNSAFRRIIVQPIELRRNSTLRASGHTFEYTGYGPGNYSTGMPTNQDKILSNDEVLISQSLPTQGGLIVYTGMNSNGEFFIGRKKYDSTTGEEVSLVDEGEIETTFFDNLTVNKLTVNNELDASTATISKFGPVQSGSTKISGDLEISEDLEVTGISTFVGLSTFKNSINVTGVSTFNDNVNVGAGASFIGQGTIPVGGIIMWSGTIAQLGVGELSNWRLCDGNGGVPINGLTIPDLRNRFIVGAGTDIMNVWSFNSSSTGGGAQTFTNGQTSVGVGSTGGRIAHRLSELEMPSHTHSYDKAFYRSNSAGSAPVDLASGNAATNTTPAGGNNYHENRPPYYALAFIIRVS